MQPVSVWNILTQVGVWSIVQKNNLHARFVHHTGLIAFLTGFLLTLITVICLTGTRNVKMYGIAQNNLFSRLNYVTMSPYETFGLLSYFPLTITLIALQIEK